MIHARRQLARDNLIWLAVVIFASLLQTNWPEFLKLQEVSPDLVLILLVYFAIAYGEERAMFTGLVGGLYQDVAVNTTLGHHVLCYAIIAYTSGRLSTRLITEHAAIKAGLVFLAGLSQGFLFASIQYVQMPQRGLIFPVLATVVPIAFYSAIVTPVVFVLADRLFHRRESISGGIL